MNARLVLTKTAALLGLVALLAGCGPSYLYDEALNPWADEPLTEWRELPRPYAATIEEKQPHEIRIRVRSGEEVVLAEPRVKDESVCWFPTYHVPLECYALEEIVIAEWQETTTAGHINGAVTAVALAALIGVVIYMNNAWD